MLTQPTEVGDVATVAVELFTAATEYVDLFSRMILTMKPAHAPNADDLLGKITDNGAAPLHLRTPSSSTTAPPHPVEQHYRNLFGWKTT